MLKRIVLLVTVGAIIAAMVAASTWSVSSAQDSAQIGVCAPWSKDWDISGGWWYFSWYRWCYDPSISDPSFEGSWYREQGSWEWSDQVNLCPESGVCKMSTG
jgi:hypothetical protein